MKKLLRVGISWILRISPAGTADFIYIRVLRPRPLRFFANRLITFLLPITVTIPEGVITLNPKDPVVSGALALGVYEPFETSLFRSVLKPGMVVLDVGANLGYHTIIAARKVGPSGRVLAFEPEPVNFALLSSNIRQNHFDWAQLHPVAVSDVVGTQQLHLSDSNKGRHSIVRTVRDSKEFTDSVGVATTTIDTILGSQGIKQVDVIKMDIEGAELLALLGMPQTLALPDLIVFVEFSPSAIVSSGRSPKEFFDILLAYGFVVHEIRERESRIVPIHDPDIFLRDFPKDQYTNLFCTKEPFSPGRS